MNFIVNVSSPYGITTPNINNLIPSLEFSMNYVTISSITNTFKVLPKHPDLSFFGVSWNGSSYFANRHSGARAAPRYSIHFLKQSAGSLSMTTNYHLSFIFWITSSPPSCGLSTLRSFLQLGIPFSPVTSEGPRNSSATPFIHFPFVSLPTEKNPSYLVHFKQQSCLPMYQSTAFLSVWTPKFHHTHHP